MAFTSFAPLGTVLVALLGVGVAERAGLLGCRHPSLGTWRSSKSSDRRRRICRGGLQYSVRNGLRRTDTAGGGGLPLSGTSSPGWACRGICGSLLWLVQSPIFSSGRSTHCSQVSPPRLLRSSTQPMLLGGAKEGSAQTANYYQMREYLPHSQSSAHWSLTISSNPSSGPIALTRPMRKKASKTQPKTWVL